MRLPIRPQPWLDDTQSQGRSSRHCGTRWGYLRLFSVVAAAMLALTLVVQWFEPGGFDRWNFFGTLTGEAHDAVNTRLPPDPETDRKPADTLVVGNQDQPHAAASNTGLEAGESASATALVRAWSAALARLTPSEAMLVLRGLDSGVSGQGLRESEQPAWSELISKLENEWTNQVRHLRETGLKPAVREAEVLASHWETRDGPALASVTGKPEQKSLRDLRTVILEAGWNLVRDNRVLEPRETLAWFACLQRLKEETSALQPPAIAASFRQLFEQPDAYRGQLVRIRGTVRRLTGVRAPPNQLKIHDYQILWAQPAGSANAPFVVYATQLPDGFPNASSSSAEKNSKSVHEDVEFTGIFFKRFAYRAQDGIRLAPVLIGRVSTWTPAKSSSQPLELPPLPVLVGIVTAAALFSIGLAYYVYRSSLTRGS